METEPFAESGSGATHPDPFLQDTLQAALAHYQAGDLLQADRVFRQVLQVYPDHSDALLSLGIIQSQLGHQEQAVELITRVLVVEPDYVEAHFNLGNVLLSQGELEGAAGSYRRALALWPDYIEAHLGAVTLCTGLAVAARTRGQSLVPDRTSISPTTSRGLGSSAGAGDQLFEGGEPWVRSPPSSYLNRLSSIIRDVLT